MKLNYQLLEQLILEQLLLEQTGNRKLDKEKARFKNSLFAKLQELDRSLHGEAGPLQDRETRIEFQKNLDSKMQQFKKALYSGPGEFNDFPVGKTGDPFEDLLNLKLRREGGIWERETGNNMGDPEWGPKFNKWLQNKFETELKSKSKQEILHYYYVIFYIIFGGINELVYSNNNGFWSEDLETEVQLPETDLAEIVFWCNKVYLMKPGVPKEIQFKAILEEEQLFNEQVMFTIQQVYALKNELIQWKPKRYNEAVAEAIGSSNLEASVKSEEDWAMVYFKLMGLNRERSRESLKANVKIDTILSNDKIDISIPKNRSAACWLGRETRWCTSKEDTDHYFKKYTKRGDDLYIVTYKRSGNQYQLFYGSLGNMEKAREYFQILSSYHDLCKSATGEKKERNCLYLDLMREEEEFKTFGLSYEDSLVPEFQDSRSIKMSNNRVEELTFMIADALIKAGRDVPLALRIWIHRNIPDKIDQLGRGIMENKTTKKHAHQDLLVQEVMNYLLRNLKP
jgi:hypothetical protein